MSEASGREVFEHGFALRRLLVSWPVQLVEQPTRQRNLIRRPLYLHGIGCLAAECGLDAGDRMDDGDRLFNLLGRPGMRKSEGLIPCRESEPLKSRELGHFVHIELRQKFHKQIDRLIQIAALDHAVVRMEIARGNGEIGGRTAGTISLNLR